MESNEKKPKIPPESEAFKKFRESFEQAKEIEEKVSIAIEFMKEVLGKTDGVSLKDFWDAKKLCGPLFKEKMNPIKRNHLWNEYTQLGDEARRLKEIMDEQSAFSIEQIELAIEALEKEIEQYDTLLKQVPPLTVPKVSKSLQNREKEYREIQQELQLLKTLISRLDALRKEILNTDMRISHKNRILKRLSKLGDLVFPKRKELIKKVSDSFILDVERFLKDRFPEGEEKPNAPYYALRSEIQGFQALAKFLTLNTAAFTKTRKILSECWDKVKEQEKEHKKEMGEKSEEHKKNYEELLVKVNAFVEFCSKDENLDRSKILDQSNVLQEEMKNTELSRDHVIKLRGEIQKARTDALDKIKGAATKAREAKFKEIQDFKEELASVIENEGTLSHNDLLQKETALKEKFNSLSLSSTDTLQIERNFSDLRSFILDKTDASTKEELEALFDERETLYEEVKVQIEVYRREMGGSSLDFEKAMTYRELFDSAKIHLDKEIEALQKLEEKLNATN